MSNLKHISEIPGIGKVITDRLISHFGTEEKAINEILNGNVAEIASIPGIGYRKAVNIVKKAFEIQYNLHINDILASSDVRDIYNKILSLIKEFAKTDYTRGKLDVIFPLSTEHSKEILKRMSFYSSAKDVVSKIKKADLEKIGSFLSKMKPIRKRISPIFIRDRIILTTSDDYLSEIKAKGIDKFILVEKIENPQQIGDYTNTFDFVIFVSDVYPERVEKFTNLYVTNKIDEVDLVPEKVLLFFSENLETLKSVISLTDVLKSYLTIHPLDEILSKVEFQKILNANELISSIDENLGLREGLEPELDKLKFAYENLYSIVGEIEIELNEKIKSKVGSSAVKIDGQQILKILEAARDGNIDPEQLKNYLPDEVMDIIYSSIDEAENKLYTLLKLDESFWLDEIFPRTYVLPLEADQSKLRELENKIKREYNIRKYEVLKDIAHSLQELKIPFEQAVKSFFELDFYLTIGLFSLTYDLNPCEIDTAYTGVAFIEAKNLFLLKKYNFDYKKVQSISYVVGETPLKIDNTNNERIVILSGANSGGKTTLLHTLLQIVILSQMGFPVPAKKAFNGVFNQVFFYAKAQGMLDAGAFETSLRRMAQLVTSSTKKLVCFDEWEAATEADAAAKIIAAMLELFSKNKSTCVILVSHLAERISRLTKVNIRIDGIEARGLDENLNLIVDRSPKFNYLAKSMPELIVQRLYKLSKPPLSDVFKNILNVFQLKEDR
ncbi:MAG: MutS-related protein [Candidatus Asgardarchaeia archaeon]